MDLTGIIEGKLNVVEKYIHENCSNNINYDILQDLIKHIRLQNINISKEFKVVDTEWKQEIVNSVIERFVLIELMNDNIDSIMDETFEVLMDLPFTLSQLIEQNK